MWSFLVVLAGLSFIVDAWCISIWSVAEHRSVNIPCCTASLHYAYPSLSYPFKFGKALHYLGNVSSNTGVKWLPLRGKPVTFLHGACEAMKPGVRCREATRELSAFRGDICRALRPVKREIVQKYAVNTNLTDSSRCIDIIKSDLSAFSNGDKASSGRAERIFGNSVMLTYPLFDGATEGSVRWTFHALLVFLSKLQFWAMQKGVSADIMKSGRRVLLNANELLAQHERAGTAVDMDNDAELVRATRDAWHIASYRLAAISRIQETAQQQSILVDTVASLKSGESELSELITLDILTLHRRRWEILQDVGRRVAGVLSKERGARTAVQHSSMAPGEPEPTSELHTNKLLVDSVASWDPDTILAEHFPSAAEESALFDALTKLGTPTSHLSFIRKKFSAAKQAGVSRNILEEFTIPLKTAVESKIHQADYQSNERSQPYDMQDRLDSRTVHPPTQNGAVGNCHKLCSEASGCAYLPGDIVTQVQNLARQRHLGCILPTKSHNDIIEACLGFLVGRNAGSESPVSYRNSNRFILDSPSARSSKPAKVLMTAQAFQEVVEACSIAWYVFEVMTKTGPFPNLETFELVAGVIRHSAGIAASDLEMATPGSSDMLGYRQAECTPRWYASAAETVAGRYFSSVVRGPLRAKAALLSRHFLDRDPYSEENSGCLWSAYTPWVHGDAIFTAVLVSDYSAAIRIFDQLLHMWKAIKRATGAINSTDLSYVRSEACSPEACAEGNARLLDTTRKLGIPHDIIKQVITAVHRLRLRGSIFSGGLTHSEEPEIESARRCMEGRASRCLTGTTLRQPDLGWMHAASVIVANRLESDKRPKGGFRTKSVSQASLISQIYSKHLDVSGGVKELKTLCHKVKERARSVEKQELHTVSKDHLRITPQGKEVFETTAALMRFPCSVWRSAIEYGVSQNDPDAVQTILDAMSQVQQRLPKLPSRSLPSWLASSLMYFFSRFKYSRACMDTFNLVTSAWEAEYKQSQLLAESIDFWLTSGSYLQKLSSTLEALIRSTAASGRWRHGVKAIRYLILIRSALFPNRREDCTVNSKHWKRRAHELHCVVAGSLHLLVDVLGLETFPAVVRNLESLRTKFERDTNHWCVCQAEFSTSTLESPLSGTLEKATARVGATKSSFKMLLEQETSYETLARGLHKLLSSFNEGGTRSPLEI